MHTVGTHYEGSQPTVPEDSNGDQLLQSPVSLKALEVSLSISLSNCSVSVSNSSTDLSRAAASGASTGSHSRESGEDIRDQPALPAALVPFWPLVAVDSQPSSSTTPA
jgi:hypothetical protein